MGFEPTTLRDLVGCSNHLSYWRLYGEQGQFVGLDWNRITRLHSQVMIGTQEVKNSLTASRCHLKAYHMFMNDRQKTKGRKGQM